MKKTRKWLIVLMIAVIISVMNSYMVYAAPNNSRGFAEYDDETAEKENQRLLEEQRKEQEAVAGKSTDNYLENLQVEGYQISPQFDKQTLEYTIIEKLHTKEINIVATPSNEKAKIEGAGKIKLKDNPKQLEIKVTAETGAVRTYIIYVSEQVKEEKEQEEIDNVVEPEEPTEETTTEVEKEKNKVNVSMIVALGIGVIMVGIVCKMIKTKRGKHRK